MVVYFAEQGSAVQEKHDRSGRIVKHVGLGSSGSGCYLGGLVGWRARSHEKQPRVVVQTWHLTTS